MRSGEGGWCARVCSVKATARPPTHRHPTWRSPLQDPRAARRGEMADFHALGRPDPHPPREWLVDVAEEGVTGAGAADRVQEGTGPAFEAARHRVVDQLRY